MAVAPAYAVRSTGTNGIGVAFGCDAGIRASVMRHVTLDVRQVGETIGLRHSASSFVRATTDVDIEEQALLGDDKRSRRLRGNVSKGRLI